MADIDTLTLTTAHAASSYGVPVAVIDGEAYEPADVTPNGQPVTSILLGLGRAFLDQAPARPWVDDRAEELAAILREVWERRASVSERGGGYKVALDGELCERIRRALREG
jgi:hypothetical protein